MTGNNLAYEKLEEEKRANQAQEKETNRANVEKEKETSRHNKKEEKLKAADTAVKGITSLVQGAAKINDPAWYNKDPQLVQDAGSFSFSTPLGSTPDVVDETVYFSTQASTRQEHEIKRGVPGLMVLNYVHTIPPKKLMKNIADKLYSQVRKANSGSRNYESTDLAMYLLAISEAYGQLVNASRLYSIAKTYKSRNYYYAYAYLRGLNCTHHFAKQLLGNLANFRARLNIIISRLNSFNLPNTFPLLSRKVWLNSTIFKDHEVSRSSNYIFAPAYIYLFKENSFFDLVPHELEYSVEHNQSSATIDLDAYLDQLESLVDNLTYSEDLGIMSGDIAKAFGDNLVSMKEMPEDFHIEETYSAEVLSQINGATVVGRVDPATAHIYTESKDLNSYIVIGNPDIKSEEMYANINPVSVTSGQKFKVPQLTKTTVNMYKDQVTPDDVMVATRLQCNYKADAVYNTTDDIITFRRLVKSYGTEVIATVNIVGYCPKMGSSTETTPHVYVIPGLFDNYDVVHDHNDRAYARDIVINVDTGETNVITNLMRPQDANLGYVIQQIASFDWAPRLQLVRADFSSAVTPTDSTSLKILYNNFDFANYMILPSDRLELLHRIACMSMYNLS